jgi:hypothetical protein
LEHQPLLLDSRICEDYTLVQEGTDFLTGDMAISPLRNKIFLFGVEITRTHEGNVSPPFVPLSFLRLLRNFRNLDLH